jgi:hypothetical protein
MRALFAVVLVTACTSASSPAEPSSAPVEPFEPAALAVVPAVEPEREPTIADPRDGTPTAVVVARLVELPEVPRCGDLHVGALAEYELETTIAGEIVGERFFAAHSCPWHLGPNEPHALGGFREGDRYRLELTTDPSVAPDTMSVWPMDRMPPFYWTTRVEPT